VNVQHSTPSATPGTPQTNTKAIVSAAWAGTLTALSGIQIALSEGITADEWLGIGIATIIAVGGGFGLTWGARNKPL
jgi:hypothetical protein